MSLISFIYRTTCCGETVALKKSPIQRSEVFFVRCPGCLSEINVVRTKIDENTDFFSESHGWVPMHKFTEISYDIERSE